MAGRNERKLEILHFLEEEEVVTPSQLADTFELEIHHVRIILLRYWREGLLYRHMINRKTKQRAYNLTEKGKARLKWLENNEPFSLGKMSCAYPRTQ